jgi:DNA mismatch repair protein MutS
MLIDDYLTYKREYQTKYGPMTLVLMEVGSFFEFYSDTEDPFHFQVAELINILVTKRNKSNPELNVHNPYMSGFGVAHLPRYLDLLVKAGYTVVLVEQITSPPDPKRAVTRIISPGTHIDSASDVESPGIAALYMIVDRQMWHGLLSYVDISTGYTAVHQFNYLQSERHLYMEEINRWTDTYQPREWLLLDVREEMITAHFQQQIRRKVHHRTPIDCRIAQMNHFLRSIYPTVHMGMLEPLETMGFERSTELAICFVELLRFVYDENRQIVQKLQRPDHVSTTATMALLNDAVHQLKLYGTDAHEPSVYHIIQKCCTVGGKRLLKHRLLNPVTDPAILEQRWDWIQQMTPELVEDIRPILRSITDYERLHRRIGLGILQLGEMTQLDRSYSETVRLLDRMEGDMGATFMTANGCDECTGQAVRAMIADMDAVMDKDEIYRSPSAGPIENRIFRPGQFGELDELWDRLTTRRASLAQLVEGVASLFAEADGAKVELVENDRDGYFISVLSKKCTRDIETRLVAAGYSVHAQTKDRKRVTCEQVQRLSHLIKDDGERLQRKTLECWRQYQERIWAQYAELWAAMHRLTSELDFYQNGAYIARLYEYRRPQIGHIDCGVVMEQVRHPIIEQVHDRVVYVKNDVNLDRGAIGLLLYGVNGAGKSSLGKAVGINLIMAQMGYYVASDRMVFYPYKRLFTRITSEDNIYKGHSSFVTEMNDLRAILRYSDSQSMIIGDEICRGTESISGLSIVASALMSFIAKRCTFLLATHQHALLDIPEVAGLPGLSVYHLTIDFLPGGEFQYGRRMMPGRGPDLYGLEIARHVLQDAEFYERALRIRDRLTGHVDRISTVGSVYNRDVIVQQCEICGSTQSLESHHIVFQKEFENNGGAGRDREGNLVVLCESCHDQLHGEKIEIMGWMEGSTGRVLNWRRVTVAEQRPKIKRGGITDEARNYVHEHRLEIDRIGVRQFILQMKRAGHQMSETTLRGIIRT